MELGKQIRDLRQGCNLTQEELASRCELTKGYISQLENDLTSPSIATLIDILTALGSSLKEFFDGFDEEEKVVYTQNEFNEKVTDAFTVNWLVPNAQKNMMEPLHFVLNAKSKTEEDVPHEGEEFGYVISGKITIHIGKKKYVCKKGESFYYSSTKVHFIENTTDKEATFIWVSTPPTF